MIEVILHNNKSVLVPFRALDRLIVARDIQAFKRSAGWVVIGRDAIRGKGGSYKGPERRLFPGAHERSRAEAQEYIEKLEDAIAKGAETEKELRSVNGELQSAVAQLAGKLQAAERQITQEKSARLLEAQKLLELEKRYCLMMHEMVSGYALYEIIYDRDGNPYDYRFLDANQAFEKITALKVEQIIGRTVRETLPGVDQELMETFSEVASQGKPVRFEHYSKLCERYFDVTAYNTEPGRFAVIFNDITEMKKTEEALRENSEKLKVFAYSVSHDLKTPAIAIYGLARRLHTLFKNSRSSKGLLYIEQIQQASGQIVALIDKINAYIAAKENAPAIERVNLQGVIRLIREEFALQLQKRRISWSEPDNVPDIKADKISLIRVLRNFVDNAIKYGGDRLSRIVIDYQNGGDHHILCVADDGVGLPKEDPQKIFGMFKRNSGHPEVEGAGLGLAIVKEIAEQHKGSVWVEPGLLCGATFCMSISKHL